MNIATVILFLIMILAPCAVAVLVGFRQKDQPEPYSSAEPEIEPATALPVAAVMERMAEAALLAEAFEAAHSTHAAVPRKRFQASEMTLEERAAEAEEDARIAQAAAARARAAALVAAARAASARAEVAAEAAEEAAQLAFAAAEVAAAARQAYKESTAAQRTLPPDHPSLDFPRSRVIRRAA